MASAGRTLSVPLFSQRRGFSCAGGEKREGNKSFRGQLYNSTAERLQREQAEQERLAGRRTVGGGLRSLVTLFGKRCGPERPQGVARKAARAGVES